MTNDISGRRALRKVFAVAAALIIAVTGFVPAQQAQADVNVYITPGHHTVAGRQWRTTCEPYTNQIERCRAEIHATQVVVNGGSFRQVNDWVFNNLTYKPASRSLWGTNPLARTGEFVSAGREWKTSCGDDWTGPNACRSWIKSNTVTSYVDSRGNRRYQQNYNQWVFNNVVYFSPNSAPAPAPAPKPSPAPVPTPPPTGSQIDRWAAQTCSGPIPSGYAISAAGVPYTPDAPYTPVTMPNPVSIANFNGAVRNASNLTQAQKTCWTNKSAAQLVKMSNTTTVDGKTVRWFPYDFDFSANPSTPPLRKGWISGLGQGAVLGALSSTATFTGDRSWNEYAQETYESYFVPITQGGFASWQTGNLWYEEYPTHPATSVLNGMNYAVVGFVAWTRATNDQRGFDLFDDIIASYKRFLPMFTLDDGGGTLATYDLVRGMKTANPLRVVSVGGSVSSMQMHGQTYRPGMAPNLAPAAELITNGALNGTSGWRTIGNRVHFTKDGIVRVEPGGGAWQGINQEIAAARFPDRSRELSLQFDMRRLEPAAGGNISGKITVFEKCGATSTALLQTEVPRGDKWGTYTYSMRAPKAGCSVVAQFLGSSQVGDGTWLEFDNISLRYADWVGGGSFVPAYDHYVWRAPTSDLTMNGSGTVSLQVYEGGRWNGIVQVSINGSRTWTVPERYTGRNINYKYHDHHPMEMVALHRALGDPIFREYALKWDAMALGYKVP